MIAPEFTFTISEITQRARVNQLKRDNKFDELKSQIDGLRERRDGQANEKDSYWVRMHGQGWCIDISEVDHNDDKNEELDI